MEAVGADAPQGIVQYLGSRGEWTFSEAAIETRERAVAAAIDDANAAIASPPAQANPTADCHGCPVRARCDEGWAYVARSTSAPVGVGSCDLELTVTSAPMATGYSATSRTGGTLSVVFEAAVGATLPIVSAGARLRLLDAVRRDDAGIEIKPWTEVYVVRPISG